MHIGFIHIIRKPCFCYSDLFNIYHPIKLSVNNYFLYILIYLLCAVPSFSQNSIQSQLTALTKDELLATSEAGISVYDLTSGQTIFNHQDTKLYRPASIEKLITGITGLSLLGLNHTFETSLYYTGTIANNELNGDLYIIGGFDPEFGEPEMNYLLSLIDSMGIKKIKGNLLGDISMTDSLYWGAGWSWDDTPFEFQPYLSPLMFCKGCAKVTAFPTQKDSTGKLLIVPASTYYKVNNQTKSKNRSAGKFTVTRNWLENGNTISVYGNVDIPRKGTVNIYTSKDFFMYTFAEKLRNRGVQVSNYSWKDCPTNGSAHFLGKYSTPITDVLKNAMKKSDNLSAEAIFYHLAANNSGEKRAGSKNGSNAILNFISKLGLNPKKYKIVDGSGVSPYNYISPELILAYLKHAYTNRAIYEQLYLCLPIAGVDGTLANRMKQGKAYRNVRAKTGTVTGVSSLAGYVKAKNGHLLAFVVINQNILEQKKAHAFQDRLCEILSSADFSI